MSRFVAVTQKAAWIRHAGKTIAVAASTGAALISVFTALYSYGVVGKSESHQAIGNLGAAWVGLQPAIETADAIGDTTHFAATVADKNGSILIGAHPTWTTGDTNVAVVLPDGSVIARGPGSTTINVVVGTHVARARFAVKQRTALVAIAGTSSDSGVVISEGEQRQLQARALDARGHAIAGVRAEWQVDDSSVARLDSSGVLTGHNAGRTLITARMDGVSAQAGLSVLTTPTAIALVAGGNQRVLAGGALPQPVVVRVTNRRGAPAPGQVVTFKLATGQGTVQPTTATTDADGRARASWTLADLPGRQTLLASVTKVDSVLPILAEADPIATNTRVVALSERPSGRAGETLDDSIAVRVTDSTGRALADVPVRWTTLDGGSVDALTAGRTDSLGVARARWTLAKKTGTQRVRAEVGGPSVRGIAPVTITATALAGSPAGILVVRGDGQRAAAGAELAKPVVLKVVDANGSGVSNATVILSPSGGTLPDSALQTDSLGVVQTRWTMGHMAKEYSLAVHVDGVKQLFKVAARATPAAPANLSFEDAPTSGRKTRDAPKSRKLYVLVTDDYGNPVPDAKVILTATSGVVVPTRAVSDAKGRAALTWTIGGKPGEQRITGVVRGTDVTGAYVAQVAGHEAANAKAPVKAATKAATGTAAASHKRGHDR